MGELFTSRQAGSSFDQLEQQTSQSGRAAYQLAFFLSLRPIDTLINFDMYSVNYPLGSSRGKHIHYPGISDRIPALS